jgi:SAM-dependent methyltransferase
LLAATHPNGEFHGIDAMAAHIDHARGLARQAAIPHARFHTSEFAAARNLELPQFDYIVAHGVYTWIDTEDQQELRRFIDRRLKPGGLVYLGYNAMPGWACDLAFQRLMRELGVAAAAGVIRSLAEAGVPSLARSSILRELAQRPEDYSPAYLAHEFMPVAWQPLYVTDVWAAMATIELTPLGSATLSENFDWMVLSPEARAMLAAITKPDTRELIRDFFLDQRFRCDVFARCYRRLDADERVRRLLSSTYGLGRPVPTIRYTTESSAGPFPRDFAASRAIVGALAGGTRSFRGVAPDGILEALLTLCAAGNVMPVEPGYVKVDTLNQILCSRVDGQEEIRWLALPSGTAVAVDPALLRLLRDGNAIDEERFPGWREFLASHGLPRDARQRCGDRARL